PLLRAEAQVERRVRTVRTLNVHRWRLRIGWQLAAHLLQSRRDLRESGRLVMVELQSHGHRAHTRTARRLDVVDATDRADRALDRRRQEAPDRLGTRAEVDRRNDDLRAFRLRVLLP